MRLTLVFNWPRLPPSVDNINRWEKINFGNNLVIASPNRYETWARQATGVFGELQCLSHIEKRSSGHVKGVDELACFGTRGFGSSWQTAA